jgi:hypothetical protein
MKMIFLLGEILLLKIKNPKIISKKPDGNLDNNPSDIKPT